jgi:hypothetical protein
MYDYSECYATLGVNPDTDWGTLRARYRRLIGQWHPDRFSADASRKQEAEEHCKRITLAYQALEKYRRVHGVLPFAEPDPVTAAVTTDPANRTERTETSPPAATKAPGTAAGAEKPENRYRIAVVVTVFVGAFLLLSLYDTDVINPDANDSPDPGGNTAAHAPDARGSASGGITAGSTLGEVYDIQGVPSFTEGNIWHYGKSSIRFAQGKVVSWSQHPEFPLRLAPDQPVEMRDGTFDIGSSKKEVRSIQGEPAIESETVWSYGPSRVYFENGRVARWEANPLHPLRVPR